MINAALVKKVLGIDPDGNQVDLNFSPILSPRVHNERDASITFQNAADKSKAVVPGRITTRQSSAMREKNSRLQQSS